ncbi:MAG TPA: tetratricopeptide repeat protein [Rhizomicrobium sp.]|nr:tetratricopeptide repeat protein [Rhizomicrobium sp.]
MPSVLRRFGFALFAPKFYLVVFVSLFGVGVRVGTADESPELRTTLGVVSLIDSDEDGHAWFEFDHIDERFLLYANSPQAEAIAQALKDSMDTGRSVSVQYFLDGGDFRFGSTKPAFVVHQITYKDKTILVQASFPKMDPNAVPLPRDIAAADLAKGVALAGDADLHDALPPLAAAIQSPALETPLIALAVKTRAKLYAEHSAVDWPPGSERDKLLLLSLVDARHWQSLSPDDSDAASAVASDLAYLGDYDAALTQYREIAKRWPDDQFWAEIRIAGIQRTLGQYDQALLTLNGLAKQGGGDPGMAYHYHRGWTLLEAGRFDEAAAEFTEGFKTQPDYTGALTRRVCAYAKAGRLKEAIADQEQYIAGFDSYPADSRSVPSEKHDEARAAEVLAELRHAASLNPSAKLDAPCIGYWDWGSGKRDRSPLLPLSPAGPSAVPQPVLPPAH